MVSAVAMCASQFVCVFVSECVGAHIPCEGALDARDIWLAVVCTKHVVVPEA
jgi:hypothetical protein